MNRSAARRRASASVAVATALTGVAASLAVPVAQADTLSDMRAAVNNVRAGSACPPLTYSAELEGDAQTLVGNTASTAPRTGYAGNSVTVSGQNDPTSAAIDQALAKARSYIYDCKYQAFGVGMIREFNDEFSFVAIALGIPPAPPPPPPPPPPVAPAPAPVIVTTEAPKPLVGPSVTADPGLTGVTFTVTDRSGKSSTCEYSSEGYTDSFGLQANGSFDLFVPALRQFRDRTGTITCDNGTTANTSVFF